MCARGGGDSRGGEMKATEDDADDDHVSEWEKGLPTNEELMPLSQSLISPALASAFSIRHEPAKTPLDVQHGARATLQNLRNQKASIPSFGSYPSFQAPDKLRGEGWVGVGDVPPVSGNGVVGSGDEAARVIAGGVNQRGPLVCHPSGPYPPPGTVLVAPESYGGGIDETSFNLVDGRSDQGSLPYMMPCAVAGSTSYERRPENSYGATRGDDSSKGGGGLLSKNVFKRADSEPEDGDSAGCPENSSEEPNARTLKRPRLVWTPQLHKRFVDAVGHLGIKNAVPKTIMQLMNVEGLTRENVASHLQKYRLYLKRVQGLSSEGPSASDQLFASTPLPPNLGGLHYVHNHRDDVGAPPFASPNVPMPYTAVAPGPMGPGHYSGYEHHPYSGVGRGMPQQSPQSDDQREQQITANENHHNHSHNYYNQTHNEPSSPPQQILTLFPTSSR